MPRVKRFEYPTIIYDSSKHFPLSDFPQLSIFDIFSKTEFEIISHYQSHNLVFTFCPNKVCSRHNNKLNLSKTSRLVCPTCNETYPSRPKVFKNLKGTHQFLYAQLFSFCLGHNEQQTLNFLGIHSAGNKKIRDFKKRIQSVIISGLETEDIKLGGGVDNPVITDEMQKGRRRKGNGKQKSHPTIVHGDVVGACDNNRYRFTMTSKEHPGPPRLEQIENQLLSWILPDSTLFTDGAKCYITFQDKHPELVSYLVQLNHSEGEWVRRVTIEGKKVKASTNKIDGSWSHLRRFFSNHMVHQKDSFRYLKEFEFFFGTWARAQNSMDRILHFMQLHLDLSNLEGPPLAKPWKDLSKSKIFSTSQLFI